MLKKQGTQEALKKTAAKKAKGGSTSKERAGPAARRKECPDCGSPNVLYETATEQLICHDCGLIFEELPPDDEKEYERVDRM
ncbi:TFIIB-type zinc ribbon-containing protein [Candidatus Woesearchaeota archaeon]|nr:TFIIB-type zinc ribbon-containing protein [Candidatus Woesearchaeota archaeon]